MRLGEHNRFIHCVQSTMKFQELAIVYFLVVRNYAEWRLCIEGGARVG